MSKVLIVLSLVVGCGNKPDAPAAPPRDQAPAPPSAAQVDAAPPPYAGAAGPDAAAAAPPRVDYLATLCPKVLPKIVECQHDVTFIAGLGTSGTRELKRLNRRLLEEIATWPPHMACSDLASTYEYPGFTAHWDRLAEFPDAVDSCATLGAAIRQSGGLFGGHAGH